jgi:hypothetical protein
LRGCIHYVTHKSGGEEKMIEEGEDNQDEEWDEEEDFEEEEW